MASLFKIGHRLRAPQLNSSDIPALQNGILLAQQFGNDWYVNSAASAGGNGASPEGAFQTLAAALAKALSGDRIYLAAGHAETIASAGGITVSQSGLIIIGLGNGGTRPTFTWSATGSTFLISGDSNVISNIRCTCSADEVVKLFSVTGAKNTLDAVDYFETASMTPIQFLLTTAAADDLTIQNCRHYQSTASAAANTFWLEFVGADRLRVLNSQFFITLPNGATSSIIGGSGTASLNIELGWLVLVQLGGTTQDNIISLLANTTGMVHDIRASGDVGTLAASIDLASCFAVECYSGTTVNKNGILDPVVA